ncbi:MAG: hypothetical protein RLY24_1291 [Actinomycetota bacterium]
MTRRTVIRIAVGVVVFATVLTGFSAGRYVLANPNDPLQQSLASWARNKGLGGVVDQLEAWLHNDPPAAAPADTLALIPTDPEPPVDTLPIVTAPTDSTGATTTTSPKPGGNSSPAQQTSRVRTSSCPSTETTTTTTSPTTVVETTTTSTSTTTTTTTTSSTIPGETTTTTTTTTTLPPRPTDVAPQVTPAIKGEGEWVSVARVRTKPIIYATSMRPLWCYGSVVATMATYDPNKVRAGLFNGTEVPGGKGWRNSSKIKTTAEKALVASFNGGFRFEHEPGGYVTEGKIVRKLRKGYATFGIRTDGTSTVGVWGKDMTNDGTWASLRQNLPPLLYQGKVVYHTYDKVDWGKDFGNKLYNFRSAVCVRTDGLMMFVAVGKVNIAMLADTLLVAGCSTAMELDINGTWPFFAVYDNFGKTDRNGKTIDKRMGDPNRHLNGSTKDFIALFDPETLTPGSVR